MTLLGAHTEWPPSRGPRSTLRRAAVGQAAHEPRRVGVELRVNTKIVGVDETGVDVVAGDGTRSRVEAMSKVWAAGVAASPLGAQLAGQRGTQVDHAGRIKVEPDCSLPGHPEVFVVGDMMSLQNLPGVAQVAMQSGRHAAAEILRRLQGEPSRRPFCYRDKGSMATVAKFRAVACIGRLRLAGFPAWLMWLLVHLVYLVASIADSCRCWTGLSPLAAAADPNGHRR
ncbi:NAD(P)/FAD-dependent oxidoreductase [Actinomadura scrupuli]|uniref:NAD(P)/FAD-dependent oxidoreductase n=1 Tax=Actinomadura scrupuli TaxID=559629 RepID=UPI003D97E758